MFYDLEDPRAFVADVAAALAEDGVWVMELHYLPSMLERNSFDAIVHEHLEYYSLAVIERLFAEAGLEIVRAELNDVNGGRSGSSSRRAGKRTDPPRTTGRSRSCASASSSWRSTRPSPTRRSAATPSRSATTSPRCAAGSTAEGKTIHVYGASTKGNTILQYAGIDAATIPYAADRNPDKWGSETIATRIPIISEEDSRAMQPDYYLALPWHFLDEFLEREQEFLDAWRALHRAAAGGADRPRRPERGRAGSHRDRHPPQWGPGCAASPLHHHPARVLLRRRSRRSSCAR